MTEALTKLKSGIVFNTAILFLTGMLLGYISVQLIRLISPEVFGIIYEELKLDDGSMFNLKTICSLCFKEYKGIFLYYIISTTAYGRLYNTFVIMRFSYTLTFFCSGAYIADMKNGMLYTLYNYVPKLLILLPLYIMILRHGAEIHKAYERGELLKFPFRISGNNEIKRKVAETVLVIIPTVIIAYVTDALIKYLV